MQTKLNLNKLKYQLFMEENKNWQSMLKIQAGEIPDWKNKLIVAQQVSEKESPKDEKRVALYFSNQLIQQQQQMHELNSAVDQQQKKLEEDCVSNSVDDIDAFCNQDILRERIKEIEKKFIDLKCSFLRYFSTSF